jgi:maltose O-acetyltransferase
VSRPNGDVLSATATTPDDAPGSALLGLVDRLREDAVIAWQQAVYCSIGGSPWLPRVLRRLVFALAGASLQSSPGIKFVLAGRARNLRVGSGVYMNRGVFIDAIGPVTIGDGCALGMETLILTSHHPIDEQGHWGAEVGRPVTIGDRVWIGARATILPGAVIDSDVVIAAGAVVAGHARPFGIYAGVPARRIRELGPGAAQR